MPSTELAVRDVHTIAARLVADPDAPRKIAEEYGVSEQTVMNWRLGRTLPEVREAIEMIVQDVRQRVVSSLAQAELEAIEVLRAKLRADDEAIQVSKLLLEHSRVSSQGSGSAPRETVSIQMYVDRPPPDNPQWETYERLKLQFPESAPCLPDPAD